MRSEHSLTFWAQPAIREHVHIHTRAHTQTHKHTRRMPRWMWYFHIQRLPKLRPHRATLGEQIISTHRQCAINNVVVSSIDRPTVRSSHPIPETSPRLIQFRRADDVVVVVVAPSALEYPAVRINGRRFRLVSGPCCLALFARGCCTFAETIVYYIQAMNAMMAMCGCVVVYYHMKMLTTIFDLYYECPCRMQNQSCADFFANVSVNGTSHIGGGSEW